jgi:hypothetical protein
MRCLQDFLLIVPSSAMRLTCRPPERTKAKHNDFHHQRMAPIPTSIAPAVPPPHPLPSTPARQPSVSPQFFSAPPVLSSVPFVDQSPPNLDSPLSLPQPTQNGASSGPGHNDVLRRIVKTDDGIKKKKLHFKVRKDGIVPPPPLSKYKRPPPIVPNRPGDRYPLGIPYVISFPKN